MGSSSSKSPPSSPPSSPYLSQPRLTTPLPPSPPVKTMIEVALIDTYGRKVNKEINLMWKFSHWAKSLLCDYIASEENLALNFNNNRINYRGNESKDLQSFGFFPQSEIKILHEQKGDIPISIIVKDYAGGFQTTILAKLSWTYKSLAEELERNYGVYGITNSINDIMIQSKFLDFKKLKDKTLRELGVKNYYEMSVLNHNNGGTAHIVRRGSI